MIKVLKSGIFTTIQDSGRHGLGALGVPISGVMDAYSAHLANHILNNKADDALIEITLGNCAFQFLVDTEISVTGANLSAKLNDAIVPLNSRIQITKNDILVFKFPVFGVRSYLAVKGGLLSEEVLKSRSQYQNITRANQLHKNDVITIKEFKSELKKTHTLVKVDENHFTQKELKCFKGPEFNLLSKGNQQKLLNSEFTIAKENSRMGYKLNESIVDEIPQILTSAVLPGTVQLTPSGKLIILMRNCQITGGYPRILQLSESAINILAQKSTNDIIKFQV